MFRIIARAPRVAFAACLAALSVLVVPVVAAPARAQTAPAQSAPAQSAPAQAAPAQAAPAQAAPAQAAPEVGPSEAAREPAAYEAPAGVESVVLLLPEGLREPWSAAVEYELGLRGTRALHGEALSPETQLVGDGSAQLAARRADAVAALWVQPVEDAYELRLVRAASTSARAVRVAQDADGRTVALIVASLLDLDEDDRALSVVTVRRYPRSDEDAGEPEGSAATELSSPSPESPPVHAEAPPERGHYVRWSGRVGLAAFGFWSVGSRFEPGAALRAGIGLRYAGFELAVMHDGGFWVPLQGIGSALQPFGRACLDVGMVTPGSDGAFHGGVRGCAGTVFASEVGSFPDAFAIEGPRTHLSAGTYVAISFRLEDWVRLFVRADLELGWTRMSNFETIQPIPTLSTYVSFT